MCSNATYHSVGIGGGCGWDCEVFLDGNCENPEGFIDQMMEENWPQAVIEFQIHHYDLLNRYPGIFDHLIKEHLTILKGKDMSNNTTSSDNTTSSQSQPRTIELPLDINCVPHWTVEDAIRELLQNAIDQGEYRITYITDKLHITSLNSELNIDSLIIGKSTKTDNQIGGYGEGYKMAIIVLLRNNIDVKLYTKEERWDFSFQQSDIFQSEILKVDIHLSCRRNSTSTNFILSIDETEARKAIKKYLIDRSDFYKDMNFIDTSIGQVSLNPSVAGRIYLNGLYITTNDKFKCGYNFNPDVLSLDRDRKIIDTYNLASITSKLWIEVAKHTGYWDKIARMVYDETHDTSEIGYQDLSSKLVNLIHDSFSESHGESAVPYRFDNDKIELETKYNGIHPVKTSCNTYHCVNQSEEFQEKLKSHKLKEDEIKTPFNLLTQIYNLIRPFLTSDLRAKMVDLIEKAKKWKEVG